MKFDPIVLNISLILGAWALTLVLECFFPKRQWYFYLAIAFTVLMVLIFIVANLYNSIVNDKNDSQYASEDIQDNREIERPSGYPSTGPKWNSRGDWAIPFSVRYAVSFLSGHEESEMGPWSPYYSSTEFSNPILSDFPKRQMNENGVSIDGIKIYRQFEGHEPIVIDCVKYPYDGEYIDRSGDDY